jgi:single-strand DNA-binding protein
MNLVILKGNITREPELTYLPKGTAVLEIGLATNEVWFDDAGEKQEEVTFVDCRAWGKRAETMAKCFTKGSPLLLHGKLRQERWEDKATGKARSKTLVVIQHWEFAGDTKKEKQGDRETRRPGDGERVDSGPQEGPITEGMEEDDIPF